MSNAVRASIGTLLSGDATLGALADGGVWYRFVTDKDASGHFCIYHLESGDEQWAMQGGGVEGEVWVVKGAGKKVGTVEDIDDRVKAVLDGADLGGDNLFCRRLGPIEYDEVESGEPTFYRGSRFQLVNDADS